MTIPATGPISLSQIQAEFGGINPANLSEYYRGGSLVPSGFFNTRIPTSGIVKFSDYRGTRKATVITYAIIGAGGGGGYGLEDGFGSGAANPGGASSIVVGTTNVTAPGGAGGNNGSLPEGASGAGEASVYGPGGASIGNGSAGRPAPVTSYGAGGGGAGGDDANRYDSSGACGDGGKAGTYLTGTITVTYGDTINITIGAGGTGPGGVYPGGTGANGFVSLSYDGQTVNFTASGTFVLT